MSDTAEQPAPPPEEAPAADAPAPEAPPAGEDAPPAEEPAANGDEGAPPADGEAPPAEGAGEGAGDAPPAEEEDIFAELEALGDPADDPPLPDLYVEGEDGAKKPLKGVVSVFCTGTGYERCGCTEEMERTGFALVAKATIMDDIRFRGAISDFKEVEKEVEGARADPVMFVANEDDIFGDMNNLQIVLTPEAMEAFEFVRSELARRKRREELTAKANAPGKDGKKKRKKRKPRDRTPYQPQPWVSMGSEADVDAMRVTNTRPLIALRCERVRRDFHARAAEFEARDAQELWNSAMMECRGYRDTNYELVRAELDAVVQACPELADAGVQATGRQLRPSAVQTQPQLFDEEERVRRLAEERVQKFLRRKLPWAELAMHQNEVLNIFRDEFAALQRDDSGPGSKAQSTITELQSFTDQSLDYSRNKVISALQWSPNRRGVIAVSCMDPLTFDQRVEVSGRARISAVLLWNFRDPIHPELLLEAPSEVTCFAFNPARPELVAGGCYNGQVLLWDLTSHLTQLESRRRDPSAMQAAEGDAVRVPVVPYSLISELEASHNKPVGDLKWLPGVQVKRGGQLVGLGEDGSVAPGCLALATCAPDGKILLWDLRPEKFVRQRPGREKEAVDKRLIWVPMHSIHMMRDEGGDIGCTKAAFAHDVLDPTLLAGSVEGSIIRANYMEPSDDPSAGGDHIQQTLAAHSSSVVALQRCPFFPDIFLSAGDWSFSIWKEGLEQPIFISRMAPTYVTAACWSLTRPGVAYLARDDGVLEVWDFLDRSHEPSMTAAVSSTRITCISFHPDAGAAQGGMHHMLAVGDDAGILHVLQLPWNLVRRGQKDESETALMQAFWDRELQRLAYEKELAGSRAKTKGGGAGAVEGGDGGDAPPAPAPAPAGGAAAAGGDAEAEKIEKAYRELEEQWMVKAGLKPREELMA